MIPLAGLAAAAGLLLVVTVVTARRPRDAVPTFEGYLDRWSVLHGGYDARGSVVLRSWLRLAFAIGRPLARRGVQPDVLSVWSVWLATAVLVSALAGDRWLLLGAALLVLSGLGDALDGCVAALTDRATPWGYVVDSMVDRVNDGIYLVAVWLTGGLAGLAVGAGAAFGLLEYLRARAGNAGMGEVGVATVGERGARVTLCAVALLAGGIVPEHAALVASACLGVLLVLSVVGLAQLGVHVRRRLQGPSTTSA
jgi:phosphatidylglycerophosphate synthase